MFPQKKGNINNEKQLYKKANLDEKIENDALYFDYYFHFLLHFFRHHF